MKSQWGGRGRGPRGRGRGWRGNALGPRGGPPPHPLLPTPMEYLGGPPMMRGHRGGYRGRPPPDNFNQSFPPHPIEPPWARLRNRPYSSGMLPDYPSGLHHRRPFLSPPRTQQSPVRPPSPLPGSEEYMQREISEKSAFLKRQLELEAPPPVCKTVISHNKFGSGECDFASDSTTENFCDNSFSQNPNLNTQPSNNVQNKCDLETPSENVASPRRNKRLTPRRNKKQGEVLSVEEIHDKIINHISNLSHGKKVNLVNQAGPSGYDIAVQQITRQKRLELSKALRDMCNNKFRETENTSELINAIIPDFDIKIEELPREVVEQLSSTLDEDVEERIQTMCIDPEVMFQQAADMLNTMLDVETEVKNDVNLADFSTPLQDEFNNFSDFQNVVDSGNIGLDSNISQNIGDSSTDFVPNDTQIQPGCTDLPFDETMASTALNFHNDPMPCQSPSIDFSIPPPMNFSVPPPINFGVPPPSICEQPNNELLPFTDFSNSQLDNNLGISDDNYGMPPTQVGEECGLYTEGNVDDSQYYSPGNPCSDENSLQATPVFNDLMMGQDLLDDNNMDQTELSLPLNVDEDGLLLQTNSCDNPPFNLMGDQESEQYFDLNAEGDDGILMPPNEQPYNLIAGQDQLPENLTEQTENYLPNVDEVDNILLPSQSLPSKNIRAGKAIILSDIRIPPTILTKVTSSDTSKMSDVLTEAAELEACLAQGEVDLQMLDTSKSKKISFTFNKTNNMIKSKGFVDDNDDIDMPEIKNSKKSQIQGSPSKRKTHTESPTATPKVKSEISEEPIKVEMKSEATVESVVKPENEEKLQKIKEKVEEKLQNIEEKVEEKLQKIKEKVEEKLQKSKEKVEEKLQKSKEKVEEKLQKNKEKVEEKLQKIEEKVEEKPQIECEKKVDLIKSIKPDIPEPKKNKSADKTVAPPLEKPKFKKSKGKKAAEQQINDKNVVEKESNEAPAPTKEENTKKNEVLTEKLTTNPSENIKEKEKVPEKLVSEELPSTSAEVEQTEKNKEKTNVKQSKRSKKVKSKSKSVDRESPAKGKNDTKLSRKSNKTKEKSFEEEEPVEKKKEKKSKFKSSEVEEYPKSESYKSKFERSRYDIFYSQKYEDGYKKKYKEKGREVVDEDRHRRSDSDRSFEKQREKFRSSDSEHSENRYKYHQEREDMRHSKRYYHDCYPPYRGDYVDYKNDYYNSQKYGYAPEYYSKQDSPYSPEEFEAKSSHHTQKHKTKYEKSHKKRSKKHKRQREKSATSLSSISSEERDSSASSLNKKTKQKAKRSDPLDTEDRSTSKGHKIPLKDRIQMLYESKFDRKHDSSGSDYDEDRKIKSEPVSPEVSRKPSPERSRSVEKLQSRREPLLSASDLREALNKKALIKSSTITDDVNLNKALPTKIIHPGTPVVPFTNKPCPALKQVEDPLREREEMIMNRDSMISFRNKPCSLGKKTGLEDELEVQQERELQLAKELPDIDNIAKIISNLSTIVKPTKELQTLEVKSNVNENQQTIGKPSVTIVDNNAETDITKPPQKSESKKYDQRTWKSPGEKKFMMEHLRRNPPYEEEDLDYVSDKKAHLEKIMDVHFPEECCDVNYTQQSITDKFVAREEEKLAYLNPEPTEEEPSKNAMDTDTIQEKYLLKSRHFKSANSENSTLKTVNEEKQNQPKIQKDVYNQDFVENQNISAPEKPKPEKAVLKLQETAVKQTRLAKEVENRQNKPKSSSKVRESEEINSTSEKTNKSVSKIEKLKVVETKPLESTQLLKTSELPSKSTKLISTDTKPIPIESTFESTSELPKKSTKSVSTHTKPIPAETIASRELHTKPKDTKDSSKNKPTITRSKSRSRSNTKEIELLHSAEVSSTSDTAAKSILKSSVDSRSRSKSKVRNSTPQPPKEESSNFKSEAGIKLIEQPVVKTPEPAITKPEDTLITEKKMLITTYTQTQTDGADNKKDDHKSKKSSKRDKTHSSSSHKSRSRPNVSTQTSVNNTNSSTQTPSARCKSVQVQIEVEEKKPAPKKAIFVQTDPVVIFENHAEDDDLDDKLKHANKSSRKMLKAIRRRRAVERMFDLDKEIERLTKLRQSLYKKLNFDSESDEDESSNRKTKVARMKINKKSPLKNRKTGFLKNPDTLHSNKNKPIAIREKSRIIKKQKKKSDFNIEKQNLMKIDSQLVVNVTNLRTYKNTSNAEIKKATETSTKSVIKNQEEAVLEGTCKKDKVSLNVEKVSTSNIDNTVLYTTKCETNIEKAKINKTEPKITPEKLKTIEQKHDLNKNLPDTHMVKEKLKLNEQLDLDMNVSDGNLNLSLQKNPIEEIIRNQSPDKIPVELGIEKLNRPEINIETLQKEKENQVNENIIAAKQLELDENSSHSNNTDKDLPDKNPIVAGVENMSKENNEPELEKSEKHQSETISEVLPSDTATEIATQQTDLNNSHPEIQPQKTKEPTPIPSDVEKPTQPETPSSNENNLTSNKETEEVISEIKIEPKTPTRDDHQPEISDTANSEAEDSFRSTRSRQKKPKDSPQTPTPETPEETIQAKPEPRTRQRRKTESEKSEETNENTRQTITSEDTGQPKRGRPRKTDSENKPDTSVERDASADEEATQSKSKKRSSDSKFPKRYKESKTIIKVKVKTTNEQKRRFQEHLQESKEVRSPPSKRRKKTAGESPPEGYVDELSKTIDEVARNQIGAVKTQIEANMVSPSTKLRKREKANEEAPDKRSKLRRSKSLSRLMINSKEFGEQMVFTADPKIKESSLKQPENQDLTSDSFAFRGFKNEPQLDQEICKINFTSVPLSMASQEAGEASNRSIGNFSEIFTENKQSQKYKKRKKTDAIELDPEIDSQNLLQIQMIKRPKSAFEPYMDSSGGTYKKSKKRYPFSGVKCSYRTKKRKSSSDANTKSSSFKKKPSTDEREIKSSNRNIDRSIVRITRYSLLQLEEMRKSIRGKNENISTNTTLEPANEEVPAIDISKNQQETLFASNSIECTEPIEKEPSDDAYNLKIVSVESLGSDAPHESNIPPETMLTSMLDNCGDVIEEELHLKEEIPSVNSDFMPEAESCNSVNSALHLETSNEAFEDFVKESMHEYKDNDNSDPPILTPEVEDLDDMKISDCEYLEVVDEDEDYKMDFEGFTGAILVIKVIASTAIAASDKGKVFCFSMLNGNLISTFDMSKLAITSMIVINKDETNLVYTGSLDSSVAVLNFNTKEVLKQEKIPEPVQCMEYAWNCIFIGSDRGSLIRYDLNADIIEDAIKISDSNVLVIKATQEGPRKVLVVATRNAPVCIRDARSGLLLRTMQTPFSPTVYTLLFEKNLIYCGTSQHDILVYTFEDGQLIFKHEATKSKGVVCMQIVGNLLFAGCYNGNIYVYNTKTNIHLGTMNGPGGLMLSMEIVRNKIIVGTKSSNFRAWRIPQKYLDQM